MFELARALKTVPGLFDADFRQLQPFVRQWHNLAKPHIGTPAFEETWIDFIHAWPRVKFPGKEPLAMIFANAVTTDPPEAVRHYESEPLKVLASLCRELQRATGDAPLLFVRSHGGEILHRRSEHSVTLVEAPWKLTTSLKCPRRELRRLAAQAAFVFEAL